MHHTRPTESGRHFCRVIQESESPGAGNEGEGRGTLTVTENMVLGGIIFLVFLFYVTKMINRTDFIDDRQTSAH